MHHTFHEGIDLLLDSAWLEVRLVELDAVRVLLLDEVEEALKLLAERDEVSSLCHRHGEGEGGSALDADERFGGIDVTPVDVDDVFEVDQLFGPRQPNDVAPELLDRAEVAARLERDGFVGDVDLTARLDDVALLEGILEEVRGHPDAAQLCVVVLDEKPLFLGAENVDFGDRLDTKQLVAQVICDVLELHVGESVAGHTEHDRVDVTELVIDKGAIDVFG